MQTTRTRYSDLNAGVDLERAAAVESDVRGRPIDVDCACPCTRPRTRETTRTEIYRCVSFERDEYKKCDTKRGERQRVKLSAGRKGRWEE